MQKREKYLRYRSPLFLEQRIVQRADQRQLRRCLIVTGMIIVFPESKRMKRPNVE